MNIVISTIPHAQQRYETVGDWLFTVSGDLSIRVSDTGDWRYDMLVAVHELVEVLICKHRGITQKAVDDFDMSFKPVDGTSEPGDDPNAPYAREHSFATGIERLLAVELDVTWRHYENTLYEL